MDSASLARVAKVITDNRNKPVFDEAVRRRSVTLTKSLRAAVRSGDHLQATLLEGRLMGLEESYQALLEIAKE
jgi:hypothetical protein